jgi:hypothetical protein
MLVGRLGVLPRGKESQQIAATMNEWIHISEVLADMETVAADGKLHTFSLAFVRDNDGLGGQRGSIKEVRIAAKFTKPDKKSARNGKATPSWLFKQHDAIPIQDLEYDRLITPKYTHIIRYNGKPVKHYG